MLNGSPRASSDDQYSGVQSFSITESQKLSLTPLILPSRLANLSASCLRSEAKSFCRYKSLQLFISKDKLPRNAVAITFDDGYACNALVAAPMLQSLNYPATFFVVSDAIERAEEFWWDQLEFVFRAPGFDYGTAMHLLHVYSGEILERGVRRESSSTANFLALWAMLRRLSAPQRRKYLDDLRGRMGMKAEMRQTHRPLTVAELRALAANPLFEIGGHTATHPSLPTLTEVDQEDEIVRGSRLLETMLGKPIRSFAYPFGDWLPITREIVSDAGFKCAVTGVHRRVKRTDNKYAMPRRQVVNWYARTL